MKAFILAVLMMLASPVMAQTDFSKRSERDATEGQTYTTLVAGQKLSDHFRGEVFVRRNDDANLMTTVVGVNLGAALATFGRFKVNLKGGITSVNVASMWGSFSSGIKPDVGMEIEFIQNPTQSFVVGVMNRINIYEPRTVNATLSFGARFYF